MLWGPLARRTSARTVDTRAISLLTAPSGAALGVETSDQATGQLNAHTMPRRVRFAPYLLDFAANALPSSPLHPKVFLNSKPLTRRPLLRFDQSPRRSRLPNSHLEAACLIRLAILDQCTTIDASLLLLNLKGSLLMEYQTVQCQIVLPILINRSTPLVSVSIINYSTGTATTLTSFQTTTVTLPMASRRMELSDGSLSGPPLSIGAIPTPIWYRRKMSVTSRVRSRIFMELVVRRQVVEVYFKTPTPTLVFSTPHSCSRSRNH